MPLVTTVVRDASALGGGMAGVALSLHSALRTAGVAATLVTERPPVENVPGLVAASAVGKAFGRLFAGKTSAVVHIHGIWTTFEMNAFRQARRQGAKIVWSPHGSLEPWSLKNKRFKKLPAWWLYQKRALQKADLLIVNSEQEKENLRKLGLRPPIGVIGNGVDSTGFAPELVEAPRDKVVLFFSRLDPKKGVLDLIDAWGRLADPNGYSLHIHGHGEPAYVRQLTERVQALELQDTIRLLPPQFGPERWRTFQRAAIYVLPTYSENFGITIAEALLAGLPVITTHATPWTDLTRNKIGWLVPNDIDELASALETAVNMPEMPLRQMARAAHHYAASRYDWGTIAGLYDESYRWLIEPSRAMPAWISLV